MSKDAHAHRLAREHPHARRPGRHHRAHAPGARRHRGRVVQVCAGRRGSTGSARSACAGVAEAKRLLGGAEAVVAVVDFPKGEATTRARVIEALEAVRAGVHEIDVVAPLPALVAGRWEEVLDDLRAVVQSVPVPVKVILETALLDRDRKAAGAAIARCAGAAWVKTSTGFGGGGATADDVALLRKVVGEQMGVKASGGIRTAADALAMVRAGADRLGASASVAIVGGSF